MLASPNTINGLKNMYRRKNQFVTYYLMFKMAKPTIKTDQQQKQEQLNTQKKKTASTNATITTTLF